MPQLRKDPVTSRWVIVAVEEPVRASAYKPRPHPRSGKTCPFCPGHEDMTPPEIVHYPRKGAPKGAPAWQVRVVPNKFPALRIEESTDKSASGLYDKLGGFGAHEVIVENPDHQMEIADLPETEVETLLRAYRDRCLDLRKDPRFKYILLFKNYGAAAGASQDHPHSQLIALPVVPSRVQGEVKGAQFHFEQTDRCLYCDMLDQDISEKKLAVYEDSAFVVLCPFASRFPFETWLLPRHHEAVFENQSDEALERLAAVYKATLARIKSALHDPPFNLMIHTLPIHGRETDSFHWHMEIIPHLVETSGFELGTGFYLNPTPPEVAAEILRAAHKPGSIE